MTHLGGVDPKAAGRAAIDYDRIEAMVGQLVGAIAPKAPPDPAEDPVALRAEYQIAVDVIKLLSDIRFRCLVFVTAIATVASVLASNTSDAGMKPALGVLGLLATLGITIYELRNSQLYEAAMHRAKALEYRLGMKGSSSDGGIAGLFGERPPYVDQKSWAGLNVAQRRAPSKPRLFRFWFVPVKHDHGLALIYGTAIGAWIYLAVYGLVALPVPAGLWPSVPIGYLRLISAALGIAVGGLTILQFIVHDRDRLSQPRPGQVPQSALTERSSSS